MCHASGRCPTKAAFHFIHLEFFCKLPYVIEKPVGKVFVSDRFGTLQTAELDKHWKAGFAESANCLVALISKQALSDRALSGSRVTYYSNAVTNGHQISVVICVA